MIYAVHHAAALLGAALTGAALVYAKGWTRYHPRAAVALWHLVVATLVLSAFGFLISVALSALRLGVVPALGAMGRGQQNLGELSAIEATALLSALAMLLAGIAVYAYTTFRSRRAQRRQRLLLSVVADRRDGPVTVIDHTAPLVYALPGREPQIVATTAAIDTLTPSEFEAVLDHERHHLSARHDLAVLPFAMLQRLFSRSSLCSAIQSEVALLLEMCADDHAARLGHQETLRSALQAFAPRDRQGASWCVKPVGGAAVTARLLRLRWPPTRRGLGLAGLGYVTILTFLATTVSLYVLPI